MNGQTSSGNPRKRGKSHQERERSPPIDMRSENNNNNKTTKNAAAPTYLEHVSLSLVYYEPGPFGAREFPKMKRFRTVVY